MTSPAFTTQQSVLAVTWDEDDFAGTNRVPLILLGSSVGSGSQSGVTYNHYSTLRTTEDALGLAPLSGGDAAASPMGDLFSVLPPGWTNVGGVVEKLGGVITSGPDVASWGPNRLDVFVSGTEHGLWQVTWDGVSWSWHFVGGVITSDPGAVASTTNHLDVFARGQEGGLWQASWNGSTCTWTFLGGLIGTGPGAASCAAGHLDVSVIGVDQQLWRRGYNGASWGAWQPLGGQWTTSPGSVCPTGTTTVQLFERAPDLSLVQTTAAAT